MGAAFDLAERFKTTPSSHFWLLIKVRPSSLHEPFVTKASQRDVGDGMALLDPIEREALCSAKPLLATAIASGERSGSSASSTICAVQSIRWLWERIASILSRERLRVLSSAAVAFTRYKTSHGGK